MVGVTDFKIAKVLHLHAIFGIYNFSKCLNLLEYFILVSRLRECVKNVFGTRNVCFRGGEEEGSNVC